MVHASCHCGAVRLTVPRAPAEITSCNCTICRRHGTLCAYFSPKEVTITGATDVYMWGDKMIEFHRCKECGCMTHWSPADESTDRMGVNCRMMEPDVVAGARIRRFDGFDTWKFLDE
jgi:hypothetical protein